MASPQPNQRAFDFGTSSSFSTKNQGGFDFTDRKVEEAAKKTDANPTPAQIEAGNYAKGKVTLHGMPISIENAKGSIRSGTDKAGKPWSVEMQSHYGYFKGTEGRDKDHVDVFIGPNPSNTKAFVVNQIDPTTGRFDEHKVMIGYDSRQEAIEGYKANYAPGWKGLGNMVETTADSLREWLKTEDTKKPAKEDDFKPQESAQPDTAKPAEAQQAKPTVNDSLTVQTLQGVTKQTLEAELEKGKSSGNFALVTASKARLAILTGDPEIIHKTLLEEMGIRAHVEKRDGDIFMAVPESHGFNAVMRMLRGAFKVMAAMTEDGKMAIRVMGIPETDPTVKDSSTVTPPAIEPDTPDFRLLPVADKGVALMSSPQQKEDRPDFYSHMGRVIDAKVPNNATPQQVMATLLGGQVKAEEIKWSGIVPKLQELAAANGGKVSKKALQEYLDGEGKVRFKEETLGNKPPRWKVSDGNTTEYFDTEDEANDVAEEWRNDLASQTEKRKVVPVGEGWTIAESDPEYYERSWGLYDNYDNQQQGFDTKEEAQDRLDELNGMYAVKPLWDDYWVADPRDAYESEKEATDARDNEDESELKDYVTVREDDSDNDPNSPKYAQYKSPGGKNYREIIATMEVKPSEPSLPENSEIVENDGEFKLVQNDASGKYLHDISNWKKTRESVIQEFFHYEKLSESKKNNYTSPHFPEIKGYVAHMRVQDYTLPDGSTTLHGNEGQNDASNAYLAARDGWVESNHPGKKFKDLPKEDQDKAAAAARKEVPDTPFQGNPAAWIMALLKRQLAMAVKENK
ncbi:MAG: hypothetical protein WCP35_21495, partial [Verrucomicrobiota bacterium]